MDRGAWRTTVHRGCKESDMTERLTRTHTGGQGFSWRDRIDNLIRGDTWKMAAFSWWKYDWWPFKKWHLKACSPLSMIWRHSEKVAFWKPGREPPQSPTTLAPWCWTSKLQVCEKIISFCLSYPVYDILLMAAWADYCIQYHYIFLFKNCLFVFQ